MVQVNLTNLLPVNISSTQKSVIDSSDSSKSYSSSESSKRSFNDILGKVSSEIKQTNKVNTKKNDVFVSKQNSKTQEDVNNTATSNKNIKNDKTVDKVKTDSNDTKGQENEVKDSNEDEKKIDKNDEKTAEVLVKALGISPEEALKMMQSLNLEDLNLDNTEDQNKLIDAVAAFAGLNEVQKNVLSDTVKTTISESIQAIEGNTQQSTTSELLNDLNSKSEVNNMQLTSDSDSSTNVLSTATDNNEDVVLNDITQKVKESINAAAQEPTQQSVQQTGQQTEQLPTQEFAQQSAQQVAQQDVQDEKSGKDVQKDAGNKVTIIDNRNAQPVNTVDEETQMGNVAVANISGTSDSAFSKSGSDNSQKGMDSSANGTVNVSADNNQNYINNIGTQQFQNKIDEALSNIKAAADVKQNVNVTVKDIMDQVVNGSKVVLSADKSEMVMDLKPESLGKLMMRIVTEKGMVMAKFTVENSQVKEVLESNMQLLKDSLEKQGLNIQSINVSVGQDTEKESQRAWERYNMNKRSEQGKITLDSGISVSADYEKLSDTKTSGSYYLDGGKINVTA